MQLAGTNPTATISGVEELTVTSNYFIGRDPTRWRTDIPTSSNTLVRWLKSALFIPS
jgi:hypothetical protein